MMYYYRKYSLTLPYCSVRMVKLDSAVKLDRLFELKKLSLWGLSSPISASYSVHIFFVVFKPYPASQVKMHRSSSAHRASVGRREAQLR